MDPRSLASPDVRLAAEAMRFPVPFAPRNAAMLAGKLAIAAAVLWVLAERLDLRMLSESFASAFTLPLATAALLVLPNVALQHAKWRLLLRRAAPGLRHRDVARSLFAGFALGLVTPARAGEFGGRAFTLPGNDRAAIAGLTATDKLASMIVTLAAGIGAGAWYIAILGSFSTALAAGIAAAAVMAAGIAAGVFLLRRRIVFADRDGRVARVLRRALEAMRSLSRRDLALLLGLSAAFYAVFIAQFVLLLLAFGAGPLPSCVAGAATVMLLKTVIPPLTFGELGIREGVAVFVLAPLHVAGPAAFNASLILFLINVLLPAAAGTVLLLLYSDRHRAAQ